MVSVPTRRSARQRPHPYRQVASETQQKKSLSPRLHRKTPVVMCAHVGLNLIYKEEMQ